MKVAETTVCVEQVSFFKDCTPQLTCSEAGTTWLVLATGKQKWHVSLPEEA